MEDYHNKTRGVEGNNGLILFEHDKSYAYMVKVGLSLSSMHPSEDHKEWGLTGRILFVGTYNGLVAIACGAKFILWNPLTRKHSLVCFKGDHHCDQYFEYLDFYDLMLCGLCYDGNKDEYHVVAAWEDALYRDVDVYLLSFKDSTERMVDSQLRSRQLIHRDFDSFTIMYSLLCLEGKVIRGLPHWVVRSYEYDEMKIFYFDLEVDEFKELALPPDGGHGKTLLDVNTVVGEDQLGCVVHDTHGSCFNVWVMKEHGKAESWTNLYKIQYSKDFPSLGLTGEMDFLGYMPSGEVLFSLGSSTQFENEMVPKQIYYAYHVGKGELREIELQDDDELKYARLRTCHLKLTSPCKATKDESTQNATVQ